jgi:hypothetical protein
MDHDIGNVKICLLNSKYGNWLFKSKEAFCKFQEACPHPKLLKAYGKYHDYVVCERCVRILEERVADDPDIHRWNDDGGAVVEEID